MRELDFWELPAATEDPFVAVESIAAATARGEQVALILRHGPSREEHRSRAMEVRRRLPDFARAVGLVPESASGGLELRPNGDEVLVARRSTSVQELPVTVIVPVRNEEKNIRPLLERLPALSSGDEVIIVESGSSDDTWAEAVRCAESRPGRTIRSLQAREPGKAAAVRLAIEEASCPLLVILDGDISVAPEEIPRVYRAMIENDGVFVNGSRSFYRKERHAMPVLNQGANALFPFLWRALYGVHITDSLCGTKAFRRSDCMELLKQGVGRWFLTGRDPFGDFDLIFSSVVLGRRIVEVPLHYYARTYGRSNIKRWRSGLMLLGLLVRYRALTSSRVSSTG